jgi:flavodoxin
MNALLVVISIHHNNTHKIAEAIAKVIDARIKKPKGVNPEELQKFDLIGFGSGIYDAKNHRALLNLVDKIPKVTNKKAFIFSTGGTTSKTKAAKDHLPLRQKLESKGYSILDEFQCKGFNTNSFLKYFGGMNKGRPDAEDIKNAEEFAEKLIQNG